MNNGQEIPAVRQVPGKKGFPATGGGSALLSGDLHPGSSGPYRWLVIGMLWLVCFFSYADRQAFFSVFPLLHAEMQLSTVQLGLLGSSFAIVYGLGGPFAGILVDRIRRKTAILAGLEFWSIVCVLSALARSFAQLLFFRASEGLGECIYYPAALSMVSDYHGRPTRSRALGILQTSVYAGTIGGGYWAGEIAQRHGWRAALFAFGGLGCVLGLLLIGALREPVRGSADRNAAAQPDALLHPDAPSFSFSAVASLFRVRTLSLLMAVFACANFVAMVLLTWMPMYLYSRFHLSLGTAALDAAIYPQAASIAGALCGGYLADIAALRTNRGRILVQMCGVLIGAPFVVLCGLSRSLVLTELALICWGFCKGIYDSNIFASAFDVAPAEVRGTLSGSMNCIGWLLGAGAAPVLVGFLAKYVSLGDAIAMSSLGYVVAGILLIVTVRYFLEGDLAGLV